jgi:hypothetical protein
MNRILLLLALFATGCTTIDYRAGPVPGLERMTSEEHVIDDADIYSVCSRCGPAGLVIPVACTCINFRTNHAVIWLGKSATQSTIEHERAHARGYDHTDGALRRKFEAWRVAGGKMIPAEPGQQAASALRRVSAVETANGR